MSEKQTEHGSPSEDMRVRNWPDPLPPRVQQLLTNPTLLTHLSDIVSVIDRELRFVYVSRTIPQNALSDVVGTSVLDHIPEELRDEFREACTECFATGLPKTLLSKNVQGMWWENRIVPITDEQGTPLIFLASTDVTERKLREEALADRESRLRLALEVSGVGTWTYYTATDEFVWDDGLLRIFGFDPRSPPARRSDFMARLHPDDRARVEEHIARVLSAGVFDELEHRVFRSDGEVRHLYSRGAELRDESGEIIGARGAIFDITARRRLEEQLREAQKLEALGQLTAGIAHNFNNLISIALPNIELLRARSPAELHPLYDDVMQAADRGIELVRQLMRFARREASPNKVATDLAAIARRTASICRATFDRRIAIDVSEEPELPAVLASAGDVEQVLLNLCLNARDALDEARTEDPRIELRVERAREGGVRVCVVDNGPGVDEAIRERLFEPFFTTKEPGKGTGLGLATAYGIVADHQGRIRCVSRPGGGSTFIVELPAAAEAAPPPPAAEPPRESRGSETILLVDDEALVRRALRGVLEHAGFAVLEASDGHQAFRVLESRPGGVDLIVLDRSMPRMSGEQFIARLGPRKASIPVVLLTGLPGAEHEFEGFAAVMVKPARAAQLLSTVRALLDARP